MTILRIPDVLDAQALELVRTHLSSAVPVDGRETAGHASRHVKRNRQVGEGDPAGRAAGEVIVAALEGNATFVSAALPARIVPPLFNRYAEGEHYGAHIDGGVRPVPGQGLLRTDLSATLFLSEPSDYEGGELCIRDGSDERRVRLPAGDMILYPAGTVHRVEPVTRGERSAAFFWIQSLVRDGVRRQMLADFDASIQALHGLVPEAALVGLHGHYHNLLRQWAEP